MDDRKRKILSSVVNVYIKTGEPVGSKALLETEDLGVSSATIRNEMNNLEQAGYLCKPHTSAGRVPSNMGYRYYVKTSLLPYKLSKTEKAFLSSKLECCAGLTPTIKVLAEHLADFSHCTVFAVSPSCYGGVFTFEIVLSGRKTLALMAISAGGSVKSCFAKLKEEPKKEDITRLSAILNSVLSGFPVEQIGDIRMLLLETEIRKNCENMVEIVEPMRNLIEQIKAYELHISGSANLLMYPEFANIETAREYMNMLSSHEKITRQLLKTSDSKKINIFIGDDNSLMAIDNTSIIAATCTGKIPVVFGLMGPTRIDYAKLSAGCEYITEELK